MEKWLIYEAPLWLDILFQIIFTIIAIIIALWIENNREPNIIFKERKFIKDENELLIIKITNEGYGIPISFIKRKTAFNCQAIIMVWKTLKEERKAYFTDDFIANIKTIWGISDVTKLVFNIEEKEKSSNSIYVFDKTNLINNESNFIKVAHREKNKTYLVDYSKDKEKRLNNGIYDIEIVIIDEKDNRIKFKTYLYVDNIETKWITTKKYYK